MPAIKISEDLLPLSDLKSHAADVVGQVQRTGRPVVLTRYGKGVAVVMSVESFEELQMSAARTRLFAALREADRAVAEGDLIEHDEVDAMLAAWEQEGA